MVKADHLTPLTQTEVTIGILQRIGAVGTRGNTLNDKTASAVSTRHTEHRLGLEGRISQITVETYENAFHWFQITGIEHIARHFHRVNLVACREAIGIVPQRITLVVITDGITEVNGIGGICLERVLQFHHNTFACLFDLRHLQLRR